MKNQRSKMPGLILVLVLVLGIMLNLPGPANAASYTTVATGFSDLRGLAVDASDNIYVTEFYANTVKKMTSNGSNIVSLGAGFNYPAGVAVNSSGNIYVSNWGTGTVSKMNSSGGNQVTLATFTGPNWIAIDSSDNLYFAMDGTGIKKMDSNGGNVVTLGSGFNYSKGVAVDSLGNIYVADTNNSAIKKMNSSGGNIVTLGSGFNAPMGLAVDSSGNVYVADQSNGAVKRMDSNGGNIVTLVSGVSPIGVALDHSGNLIFCNDTTIMKIHVAPSTVTYNGNGNSGGTAPVDSNSYLQGATVTAAGQGTLVRTGYTFAGWNTAANGTGTNYAAGSTFTMGAANVTLYAKWTALPTYTVTYNGNGNTGGTAPVDSNSYVQGATVTAAGQGTLVKTGYTFVGWNTAANGSGTSYAAGTTFTMGGTNVTLYAKWTLPSTPTSTRYTVTVPVTDAFPVPRMTCKHGWSITAGTTKMAKKVIESVEIKADQVILTLADNNYILKDETIQVLYQKPADPDKALRDANNVPITIASPLTITNTSTLVAPTMDLANSVVQPSGTAVSVYFSTSLSTTGLTNFTKNHGWTIKRQEAGKMVYAPLKITSIDLAANYVVLNVYNDSKNIILNGQTVIVSYKPPTDVDKKIKGTNMVSVAEFKDLAVGQNQSGLYAPVMPDFLDKTVSYCVYNKVYLKFGHVADGSYSTTGWTIKEGGKTKTIDSIDVVNGVATFVLSSDITTGKNVTVAYAVQKSGNYLRSKDSEGAVQIAAIPNKTVLWNVP